MLNATLAISQPGLTPRF